MQTFCEKDQSFFLHICENFIFSWNHGSKLKLVLDNHVENFIIKLYLQNYFIICKVVAREMACCAQIKYSIKLLNGLKFNTFSRCEIKSRGLYSCGDVVSQKSRNKISCSIVNHNHQSCR